MLHQIEFLLEGEVLPLTIGRFSVSKNLLLEAVEPINPTRSTASYAIAYFAVEGERNYFRIAIHSVDFFVFIHCFVSGQPVTTKHGGGIQIKDYDSLGRRRITFGNFEKVDILGDTATDVPWPIYETKKRYLELLPDRQTIMESHLGIALSYYYFAIIASQRRLEEAIIDLTVAMEALLITRSDGIRGSLSRRLASLIADKKQEKTVVAKRMCELYDLRSEIIHGRGKEPTLNDGRQLFGYAQKAIDKALSLRVQSKQELISKLDSDWNETNDTSG
jgi:hypothetical protein